MTITPETEKDYELSEEMVTYWTNFMKTGKPAGEGTEAWESFSKENQFLYKFE